MLSCSCWLSNDACYIPWFYQLRVLLCKMLCQKWWNKTVKSNQSKLSTRQLQSLCEVSRFRFLSNPTQISGWFWFFEITTAQIVPNPIECTIQTWNFVGLVVQLLWWQAKMSAKQLQPSCEASRVCYLSKPSQISHWVFLCPTLSALLCTKCLYIKSLGGSQRASDVVSMFMTWQLHDKFLEAKLLWRKFGFQFPAAIFPAACVSGFPLCVYLQVQRVPSHISNGFLGTLLIIPWTSQIMTDGIEINTFRNTIAMCHCSYGLTCLSLPDDLGKSKVLVRQGDFWKNLVSTCRCHRLSISRHNDNCEDIILVLLLLLSLNVIFFIMIRYHSAWPLRSRLI